MSGGDRDPELVPGILMALVFSWSAFKTRPIVFAVREPLPGTNLEAGPVGFANSVLVAEIRDLQRKSSFCTPQELTAAHALAAVVEPDHLEPDYVIPSVFDRHVAPVVADAVAKAAAAGGVARRARR